MCKISLSLIVLAAIIGVSTCGILGNDGTKLVGDIFGGVAKPVASAEGIIAGGLVEGPEGAAKGSKGAIEITQTLEDNIKSTENKGTGEQIGGIAGSGVGFLTGSASGVLKAITSGSVDEALATASKEAKTGTNVGDTVGDVAGTIL